MEKQGLSIDLNEEVAQGQYANFAVISHSPSEFVVDFIRIMPNIEKARVQSRIILSPEHALRLKNALEDNIKKYEALNGPIHMHDDGGIPVPPLMSGEGQA